MPSYDRGYPFAALIARRVGRWGRGENGRVVGLLPPVFERTPMLPDRGLDTSNVISLDETEQLIEGTEPAIGDDHCEASVSSSPCRR